MGEYKIIGIVEAAAIPDWERRPAKWSELVDQVLELEPGKTMMVHFAQRKTAERARNAVRDGANQKARAIVVRTRLLVNDDGSATLYLSRLEAADNGNGHQPPAA